MIDEITKIKRKSCFPEQSKRAVVFLTWNYRKFRELQWCLLYRYCIRFFGILATKEECKWKMKCFIIVSFGFVSG
jgi:hypothetical protein